MKHPNPLARLARGAAAALLLAAPLSLAFSKSAEAQVGVVTVSADGDGTVEEGGTITFRLSKSPPGAFGFIRIILEGTATGGGVDYGDVINAETGSVLNAVSLENFNVAMNRSERVVTITTVDDSVAESAETITMRIESRVQSVTTIGSPSSVTVTIQDDDAPVTPQTMPEVSITGGSATEGGMVSFDVTLSDVPGEEVVVAYATSVASGDTAEVNDFSSTSDTLTFMANTNTLTQTVMVQTTADDVVEGDETFTMTISAGGGGFPDSVSLDTSATTATGTITDDDTATVGFTSATASGTEGQAIEFTVTLSATSEAAVTLNYATAAGTAGTDDFTAVPPTALTFAASASGSALTQTITIMTADDTLVEDDETFTVTLSAAQGGFPDGVMLGTSMATGTITEDDMATVSIEPASGAEGGNVSFTVTLSASPGAPVMVNYATSVRVGDTAFVSDFTDMDGTLTFDANTNDLTQTINVPAFDDNLAEGDETFTMQITAPGGLPPGVTLGASTIVKGTILANDMAMVSIGAASGSEDGGGVTFTVEISGPPGADVVVRYDTSVQTGDTAAQADFTASTGTVIFAGGGVGTNVLTQTFTVPVTDDNLAEGAETFTVMISPEGGSFPPGVTLGTSTAKGTITGSDEARVSITGGTGSEGGSVTFTVELTNRPAEEVVVNYSVIPDSAEQADFTVPGTELTFMAGTTTLTQTINVAAVDDDLAEGIETFTVSIGEGGGGFPDGVELRLGMTSARGTIEANDPATVSIEQASSGAEGTDIAFEVTLSGPPGADVVVGYSAMPGSAAQTDFNLQGSSLIFSAEATGADLTRTINVAAVDDNLAEGAETFTVMLDGTGFPPNVTLTGPTATGTIEASDPADVSIMASSGSEDDGSIEFTVELSGPPGADVSVLYGTAVLPTDTAVQDADFTETTHRVEFLAEATGSDLTRTFTVPVIDDDLAEGAETFTVLVNGQTLPPNVELANEMTTGTIEASDPADLSISRGSAEEGEDVTFTVALSGGTLVAGVMVDYATSVAADDTAVQADFTAASGTLTFPAGATDGTSRMFMVSTTDDGFAEGPETFTVTLSAGGSGFPPNVELASLSTKGTIGISDEASVGIQDAIADEDDGSIEFTVTLGRHPGSEVTVHYATSLRSGENAAEQADFTADTGTVVFAAESSGGSALVQRVTIPLVDDDLAEGAETFTVTLTAPPGSPTVDLGDGVMVPGLAGGVTLDPTPATGTIRASDPATVSIADAGGPEGDGSIEFTVELSNPSEAEVVVDYATSVETGDTAVQADFTTAGGTLTFDAETTDLTQTFTVALADDSLAEGSETFTVALTEGGSGGFPPSVDLGTARATGTIQDDDAAMVSISGGGAVEGESVTFTVTLSGSPGADVVVAYATSVESGDTAVQADFTDTSGTLTFAAGTSTLTQTVPVPVAMDVLAEGSETFTVILTEGGVGGFPGGVTLGTDRATGTIMASDEATVSISAASGAEGGNVTFTVTLSGSPGANVVVAYATSPGSAVQADFTDTSGTLTFAAGASGGALMQTIDVPAFDDDLAEGEETFTVTISAGSSGFPGGVMLGTATATGRIEASDAATVSIANASGSEASGVVTFTVTLSGSPGADVEVDYATSPGSAAVDDFTAASGMLTFMAGTTTLTQTFDVSVMDDEIAEGDEMFSVTLTEGGSTGFPDGVMLGALTAMGTIEASDAAMISIESASALEGESIMFTVTLSGGSISEDVTVDYATSVESGDTATQDDFTDTMGTLIFVAGATDDLVQTFSVPTAVDPLSEGDETFTVTLTQGMGFFSPDGEALGVMLDVAVATGTILDDVATAQTPRLDRVNDSVQPRLAQAVVASTLSAITGRIDSVATGAPPASGLAGKPNLLQALRSGERGLEDGTLDLERLLGDSSFVLPLNAAEDGLGGLGGLAVWGSGDYRRLSGPDDSVVEWDGSLFVFHVGADARVRPGVLAGLSVSRSLGSFDYTDRTAGHSVKGSYESRMTSLHPYVSWSSPEGAGAWATLGYGWGDIEVKEEGVPVQRSDTNMKAAAVGGRYRLLSDEGMFEGGAATLSVKGEGSLASVEVEGGGLINPLTSDVQRLRLSLEGGYECSPGSRECLAPSVEVGVRHDGGDGITGTGAEVGGGLRYTDSSSGLTVEARARVLLSGQDGAEDWGVGGLVRLDPGADGLGLSLDLAPAFGDEASKAGSLYEQDAAALAAAEAEAPAGRLDAELGYGFAGLQGVVTPYTGLSLADEGSRTYRVGGRLRVVDPSLSLSLEGERRESGAEVPDHGVMLRGRMQW